MNNNLKKELEEVSPYLVKMKQKPEAYRVPDGFYDELQNRVFAQLEMEGKPIEREVAAESGREFNQTWQLLLTRLEGLFGSPFALSSVSFSMVMLLFYWQFSAPQSETCAQLACLSATEIQQYVEQHVDEFDTETLWMIASSDLTDDEPPLPQVNSQKFPTIEEASEPELQLLLKEMIDSDELSEEELREII